MIDFIVSSKKMDPVKLSELMTGSVIEGQKVVYASPEGKNLRLRINIPESLARSIKELTLDALKRNVECPKTLKVVDVIAVKTNSPLRVYTCAQNS